LQGEGKDRRVIAYESRKLNPAESRYEVHDRELLAVVDILKKWKHYLHGARFEILTDNWATKYIQSKPHLNSRQARWMETLQEFDFDIRHRPGSSNVVADALSRRPDYCLSAMTWVKADDTLMATVRAAAASDPEYQRVKQDVVKGSRSDFRLLFGLLYKDIRLYVPLCDARQKLLSEAHDAPLSGHLGRDKTYDRLSRAFYWPRMHHMVNEYCRTCPSCQAIKADNRSKLGLLYPNPVPSHCFESISLDFITQLPPTKAGYTAILVFVDRLSKKILVEPTINEITAKQAMDLFFRTVFRHHGMPRSIVSDRDPKFTAELWSEFHKRLGTKLNMSTANHPETDGQTENVNRTLEDMIRAYVSPYHDDWDEHLVSFEFAYNDSLHPSTGYTPFYLNHGRHPLTPLTLFCKLDEDNSPPSVKAYAAQLRADVQNARAAMTAAQARQAKYANQHRRDCVFEVGDKVWLSASHLRLPAAANVRRKLQPRFYGPYRISEVISRVAYRLDLPQNFKIHPVIHISHLKAYADGSKAFPDRPAYQSPPPPEVLNDEEYFPIDAIRNHRGSGQRLQYLVHWAGYGEDENTWLSLSRLKADMTPESLQSLLDAYYSRAAAPATAQVRSSRRRPKR